MKITALCLIALCSLLEAHRLPLHRAAAGKDARDNVDGRLPRDMLPYHYNIDVTPNFYLSSPPFPFDGVVSVWFECTRSTSVLTLNSYGLIVTQVAVTVSQDSPTRPPSPIVLGWTLDEDADFLLVSVVNPFEVGAKYVATIEYTGIVNSYEYGLYWDSYVSKDDGSTKYILATQLEEHGAREMFPCFDEPDLKATFNVTVAYMPTMTALSNMPVINTLSRPNNWLANVHQVSPVMSTYQVCICIGDLRYVETAWQGILSYPVRIYFRPEMIDYMALAANVTVMTQKWLEAETGIPYLLPKMDHIALPSKGGAMENWGLITYGEPYFAVNPEISPASGRQLAASFIAHELAHQWYGNLVTAKWWDDIWLNEGFATYYDYRPLESIGWPGIEPLQLDTQYFMDSDQLNTSDPVRKVIDTPWDAGYAFFGSTYPKGGAMVYMLEGIMGSDSFHAGMTSHLNSYSYSSATTDDLWQSLSDQASADGNPLDIKAIMDPWLNQMGFPLLSVARNSDGTARVSQVHFLHPPAQQMTVESPWNYKWTIPISVVTASSSPSDWDARPTAYLNINDTELILTGLPTSRSDWIMVNPKQKFYYRVDYDDENLAAIVNQLVADHTVIHPLSRCQFVDDIFTLARSLYVLETAAMEATRYLGSELSYNPWYATLKYISLSGRMVRSLDWYSELTTYILSLVTPVYNEVGWVYRANEVPDYQMLRRDMISWACSFGLRDCVLNARADYNMYRAAPDLNSVSPTNLPNILCRGVVEGSVEDWMIMFTQYQNRISSSFREERYAYLYAMACTSDSDVLDSLLSYIVRGFIAPRDQYRATLYMAMNPVGAPKIFDYFDNSWSTIPPGIGRFTILRHITSTFADQAGLNKLNALIAKNPPQNNDQWSLFNQMTLTVQQNIDWLTVNGNSLRDWLVNINGRASTSTPAEARFAPLLISTVDYWHSMDVHSRLEHDTELLP